MTKKSKSTKKALLLSAGSLMLSCAMLVGTTFAWFTDEVKSKANFIAAGNLDVSMKYKPIQGDTDYEDGEGYAEVTNQTALFGDTDDFLWEPGVMLVSRDFKIENEGTLALQYKLSTFAVEETKTDDDKSLTEVIKMKVVDKETYTSKLQEAKKQTKEASASDVDREKLWAALDEDEAAMGEYSDIGVILPKSAQDDEEADNGNTVVGETKDKVIVLYWKPNKAEIDNVYNIDYSGEKAQKQLKLSFGVSLFATQTPYEKEKDSFDENYDDISIADAPTDGSVLMMDGAGYTFTDDYTVTQSSNGTVGLYIEGSGTVDLNGKNITSPGYGLIFQPDWDAGEGSKTSNVVLNGNGTIKSTGDKFAVVTLPGVTMTVEGGTYGNSTSDLAVYVQAKNDYQGKIAKPALIINGGTFKGLINLNNHELEQAGQYIVINNAEGLTEARFQELDKQYIDLKDTNYKWETCQDEQDGSGQYCKLVPIDGD